MPYQPTWQNPYLPLTGQAQPMMPMPQYQQPVNGITKVNGRDSAMQYQLPPNSMSLDRTGVPRLATCDPVTKTIRISKAVPLGMFDQVYLHEAAHAIMEESGVSDLLSQMPDGRQQVIAEELLAWFLEHHAVEAIDAVSSSLGRRVCVSGTCIGRE